MFWRQINWTHFLSNRIRASHFGNTIYLGKTIQMLHSRYEKKSAGVLFRGVHFSMNLKPEVIEEPVGIIFKFSLGIL